VAPGTPADQATAYQVDVAHDGDIPDAGLAPPLAQAWSVTLPGAVSYPLIVNGMVFVTAADKQVYALNQATGATVWSHSLGGTYAWSGLTYDQGRVFTLNNSGLLTAFDPTSGAVDWSEKLPVQYFFSSAPTAADGIVYISGAGSGGTLYAVRESDGDVLWSRSVENGDDSSPAIDDQAAYVSYACGQDYAFDRTAGDLLWHHTSSCEGGGGKTSVVASGTVFARDGILGNLMLSASTGSVLGNFTAGPAPAVADDVAFMVSSSTVKAIADAGQGSTSWQFSDGHLDTAPLLVGDLVFVGSSTGALYALDAATGTTSWSTDVGSAVPGPDEQNVSQPLTGLGAANGTLLVPAGTHLIAYRTAGAITDPPANQSSPNVDGVPAPGRMVAADVGIWSGLPGGYGYQWKLCDGDGANCDAIDGATGASFTPTSDDVGSTLRVDVTGSNDNGSSAPVESSASPAVLPGPPVNQTPPTIDGTAQEDETLFADPGTWSDDPTDYRYQWRRCDEGPPLSCDDIPGATDSWYTAVADDVGYVLEVRVVATDPAGDSAPADSDPTDEVIPALSENLSPPTISGTAQEGQTLTADPGEWSNDPFFYSYQWFTCDPDFNDCPDMPGANDSTYVVQAADAGRYIGVEVIATNEGGDSYPADSDVVGPALPAAPANVTPPTIAGTAQEGQMLTAGPGTWHGSITSYTYRWYTCNTSLDTCNKVPAETGTSYRIGAGDVGRRLMVGVVAHGAGGTSDEELSHPTDPVLPARPMIELAPAISGPARQGQTLTASPGTWSNSPTGYGYQWRRCDAAGTGCVDVLGATAATYDVSSADLGARLVIEVVAVNAGGHSAPADSNPTSVVMRATDDSFKTLKLQVRANGSLRLSEQAQNPGTYRGIATTSSADLTSKACRRHCPRPHRSDYGKGSATATDAGTTILVINPTARARKALANGRVIHVRLKVTFQSSLGGTPSTHTYSLTVKGKRGKSRG